MTHADPATQAPGVLRRMLQARAQVKLGQGGAPQLPASPAPTPARAAATAIGRAADRLYQLPVRALSVQPGALTLAELPELLHLSSRCYVMSRGRIVAEVAGDGLTEAAILSHYFGH